jgi:hypothetical protein
MRIPNALICVASLVLLTGCIGKINLTVERKLEPGMILPTSSLTETVSFRFEAPPGATSSGQIGASLPAPSESAGWKIADLSDASKAEYRMSRTRTGDAIFAAEDDALSSGLGPTAIRITDYFVARRYEIKIAVAGTGERTAAPTDPLSGALAAALLGSFTYDHVVVMPGIVTGHDASESDGSKLTWHVGLVTGKGRVMHAESLYPDPVRAGLAVAAVVVAGATLILLRRMRRTA